MGSKIIGHQRWQVFFAIALQTAGVGAMSTATLDNPVKSIILTVIISMCTSLVILNCLVLVGFGIVRQSDMGTAAGLAGTSRLLFGAVGLAIFSNVSGNEDRSQLTPRVTEQIEGMGFPDENIPDLVAAASSGPATGYDSVPGLTPAIKQAAVLANQLAYLDGAHWAYYVALAFVILGCISALFMPSVDVRKYTKNTVALQEADREHLAEKKEVQMKAA